MKTAVAAAEPNPPDDRGPYNIVYSTAGGSWLWQQFTTVELTPTLTASTSANFTTITWTVR